MLIRDNFLNNFSISKISPNLFRKMQTVKFEEDPEELA